MPLVERVAGAPISWGVCEVPGWGHQASPERVLAEMRDVGLVATELGPEGFLPRDPRRAATLLGSYGLELVGGFVPVVLHDEGRDPLEQVGPSLALLAGLGASTVVLAADSGQTGYDARVLLDEEAWTRLSQNLTVVASAAADHGLTATLHPHVGTVVERSGEVRRVLDGTDVPLCLDTGHLLIGGTDPAALAAEVPDRVSHVHLKDVDAPLAERVRAGELGYAAAVAKGLYRPLGGGDVDLARIVAALEGAGYDGWYVLEQDTVLDVEPAPGEGPVADVRASLAHLLALAGEQP